jgi:hypothetical protein
MKDFLRRKKMENQTYTNCKRCERLLKRPKSIIRGYGPICFRKAYLEGDFSLEEYEEGMVEHEGRSFSIFDFERLTNQDIDNLCKLPPIILEGHYNQNRQVVIGSTIDKIMHTLDPFDSFSIKMHSPDGFNWGYNGSGPAQLALAIILLYIKDKEWIFKLYQNFKAEVIAGLPQGKDFKVTIDIGKWFKKYL